MRDKRDRVEPSWLLPGTALSQAEHCPRQPWVKLSAVQDRLESSWAMSRTDLSQAERCPGQTWVKLSAVQDRLESSWALSMTDLSQAERCPGQTWVKMSAVRNIVGTWVRVMSTGLIQAEYSTLRDRVESSWALFRTGLSQAEHFSGQGWVKLSTVRVKNCVKVSAVRGRIESRMWVIKHRADRDKVESSWALLGFELSQGECCLGQSWVKLSPVLYRVNQAKRW